MKTEMTNWLTSKRHIIIALIEQDNLVYEEMRKFLQVTNA